MSSDITDISSNNNNRLNKFWVAQRFVCNYNIRSENIMI